MLNKDIAGELIKRGLLTQQVDNKQIRFLEKVGTEKSFAELIYNECESTLGGRQWFGNA